MARSLPTDIAADGATFEYERDDMSRRALRRGLAISGIGHLAVAGALVFAPAPTARPLPPIVSVDLMAALPKPAASRPAPAPPAPAPTPAPAVKRPPPAPPPKPAKRVLPKDPPPLKLKPRKVVKPPPKPQKLDYDDALAKLRDELGEPAEEMPAEAEPDVAETPAEGSSGGAGVPVSPEVLRWINQVKRHVRSTYVTPPEFLNRRLETCMTVFLSPDGRVLGDPTVTRSSGDIFWDDNAVRAMLRASPLPPPPGDGGDWHVCYPSEERE